MKITMYELLGLVKDGKAPKKIKYNGSIYTYREQNGNKIYQYEDYNVVLDIQCFEKLNDEVEILEEEKEIPEKLDLQYKDIIYNPNFKEEILMYCDNLQYKLNEIIDYLKSKGDK